MSKDKPKKLKTASISKVFITLIWPRRWLLVYGLGLILVNRLCGLVLPYSTKILIDNVVVGEGVSLWLLLTVVSVAVVFQGLSSFALTRTMSVEAQRVIAQLRAKIQRHVIDLPLSYFDNTKSGTLVSRIMSDVDGVRNLVGTGLVQLVGGSIQSLLAFSLLLHLNYKLTFIAIVPLGIFGFISARAFRFVRPIFRERREINADVTGRLTETLGGIRVIKGFNAIEQEQKVFEEGVDRLFNNIAKSLTATSLVTSSSLLILGFATVCIMGFGGSMLREGQMSVGDFFAFTFILGFMVAPIVQMANIGTQITEAFAGLDRMEDLLSMQRESDEPNRTTVLNGIRGRIEFENVSFSYDGNNDVLKDVSLLAEPGTVTALVGSSGSGKTTLAGLAASFLTPRSGTVTVDGVDLSTVELGSYRQNLGVVLQDEFLFEGSIRENLLFANPSASEEEIGEAVELAHVKEFSDRFDDGLETVIGERGVKLSGGQRQRVSIARALLAKPQILLLDEATSSLDAQSEQFIQNSLKVLLEGRTTFVIAHRLSTIRMADQILVIEDGSVVERGTHDELLSLKGRYHELYNFQARI